jgi:hypothetical protein
VVQYQAVRSAQVREYGLLNSAKVDLSPWRIRVAVATGSGQKEFIRKDFYLWLKF